MSFSKSWAEGYSLQRVFMMFIVILAIISVLNISSGHLMSTLNNISVWWHVAGAAIVIAVLVVLPENHMSVYDMFTMRVNNSAGLAGGETSGTGFWFYVLPLGFLLTQYTITGFDASAHVSEETSGASNAAAKGIWQSILFSAIGGWLLLLAFLYAATDVDAINKAGGFSPAIFLSSLPLGWVKVLLVITCVGQFLCGMSCITAGSRMLFAFSRDKAVPGHKYWTKLDKNRNPSNAAFGIGILAAILTLPALWAPEGTVVPVAFFAVTSVTVIGLFLSFLIPIYLRWRMGDKFKQGSWNLGNKWKWMAPIAIVEIVFITIVLCLPTTPAGVPGNEAFTWKAVQYAPLAILFVIGAAMLWWQLSAKKWFTGPKIVN